MRNAISERDDSPRLRWQIALGAFVAAFVLRFGYLYLDDLTRARPGTFATRFIEELTGIVASFVLFLGVVWLERRRPLDGGRWRANLPWHVLGLVLYSVVHTTLMGVTRWTLFPLVGMGPYDYGIMPIRYFMEAGQDVVSYGAFIAVLTLLRVQRRLQREQLRTAELARDAAESRLEALGLRLQPHFLFNALNTISSTVYDDPVAADTMIGHLGDLLRHALRTADQREISVADELDVLHAYLAIVDARFGDRVECELDVHPVARTLAIPTFLLQPLVENAIRHGSATEASVSHVLVRISIAGQSLWILVENDIAPFVPARAGSGTGLRTTKGRLQLLYGDDQELVAGPVGDGTRFRATVRIPVRPAPVSAPAPFTLAESAHAGTDR
ncbi:MAG TPA: histidine kinase [Candidatus Elarobacter sp.]|nr:histidine kinase [Candidatus Elarobacter sp.]